MAFPQTILPIKGELYINGAWVDVTSYCQGLSGQNAFDIRRGYSNEQKSLQASSCSFTLNNPEGRFNNRNPLSPYFEKLPKNTPFRVSVTGYTSYLSVTPVSTVSFSAAYTANKTALEITGDIDIALDIEPTTWVPGAGNETTLAGKYSTLGNERAWLFTQTSNGSLALYWSPDGTLANRVSKTSTVPLPTTNARLSVRAFLDVNNGAAGNTVTFYYSTTGITGPWTQLGSSIVTAGVTSIVAGTVPVDVGGLVISNMISGQNFSGSIYKFLLKNSAGTTVTSPDFTAQELGVNSFTDAQGNVFVLSGARITNNGVRFAGEVARFPYQADSTNKHVFSRIDVAGISRRLSQGAAPLRSPMYRVWRQYNPTAYFPMEDGSNATIVANEAPGGTAGTLFEATFEEDLTLPGTAGVIQLNASNSNVQGSAVVTANASQASGIFFFKMPALPPNDTLLMRFFGNGTIRKWEIWVSSSGYRVDGFNAAGTIATTSSVGHGTAVPTGWTTMYLNATASGGTVNWSLSYASISVGSFLIATGSIAGTVGRFTRFEIFGNTNLIDTRYAHIMINQSVIANNSYILSANGYINEAAGLRIARLSTEEGVPFISKGDLADTELMGRQTTNSYLDLLNECASVDDGLLVDARDFIGLEYITRAALLNLKDSMPMSFSAGDLSGEFLPVDDDQRTRNDVTVSRPEGSSARVVQSDGPNTPVLIGSYQDKIDLNANNDPQLTYLAGWRVFLGTWDDPRYEQVEIQLSRSNFTANPTLMNGIVKSGIGSMGSISNIPVYQTAYKVEFLVLGYQERLSQFQWDLAWNAIPYGTFKANFLDATNYDYSNRADGTDSKLVSGVNSTATSLSVTATNDPLWIITTTPYDIRVGGEIMTVTAVTGASFPQTFTVTRSINGVVKSHLANVSVRLAQPFYTTL